MATDRADNGKHRFRSVKAGEWVQPVCRGYLMKCCDCGLVHKMDFRIHRGRVQLRAWRVK